MKPFNHRIVDNCQNNKPSADDLGDQQMPGVPHPLTSHTVTAVAQMIVDPSTNRTSANALWVLNEVLDCSNDELFVPEAGIFAEPRDAIRENPQEFTLRGS